MEAKSRAPADDSVNKGMEAARALRLRMGAFGEELARTVAEMDRDGLIRMLTRMECAFRLDFTDEFLRSVSLERLRHIVLSAGLHPRVGTARPA